MKSAEHTTEAEREQQVARAEERLSTQLQQMVAEPDDDDDTSFINVIRQLSPGNIIGGEFLIHSFFRRQAKLLGLLVVCTICYISNRYSCEQELLQIDRLKKELTDIRYEALTRSSELTEKSRQSRIQEYISREGSELQTATAPSYVIE